MKTIYKLLNPSFLRHWDEWLLGRYPAVWRTRGHYVLFYALLATLVLFVAGFCYPVSVTKLTIDPIKPIVMGQDSFYILPLVILSFGLLYWAYKQYQFGFPFYQAKQVGATLLIYAVCFYLITAIAAPAFKLGALVRTAWFLMDEKDIKYWEDNDFFAYGFLLKESDTLSIDAVLSPDSFFREREAEFRKLRLEEDLVLENRYNTVFIDSLLLLKPSLLSWLPYESYRGHLSDHLSDLPYRSYLIAYERYYLTYQYGVINKSQLEKYAVPMHYDPLKIDSFTLTSPKCIFQMEDAILSVRHARQYLKEQIIFQHASLSLLYLPLWVFLLFATPFMAFRPSFAVICTAIPGLILLNYAYMNAYGTFASAINALAVSAFPIIGFLIFLHYVSIQKQGRYVAYAFHLVMTGPFIMLLFIVSDVDYKPLQTAFFGVQGIGLAGAFLVAYLQKLPKRG